MSGRFVFFGIEKEKSEELYRLFEEWIVRLSKNKEPIDNGNGKRSHRECFVKDGFGKGTYAPAL